MKTKQDKSEDEAILSLLDDIQPITKEELETYLKGPTGQEMFGVGGKSHALLRLEAKIYTEIIKAQYKVRKTIEKFDKSSSRLAWIMIGVAVLQVVLIIIQLKGSGK